jgi:hypothetical protein
MENMIDKNLRKSIVEFLTSLGYYGYVILKDKLQSLDGPSQNTNRNFLFMPYKLKGDYIDFNVIFNQS